MNFLCTAKRHRNCTKIQLFPFAIGGECVNNKIGQRNIHCNRITFDALGYCMQSGLDFVESILTYFSSLICCANFSSEFSFYVASFRQMLFHVFLFSSYARNRKAIMLLNNFLVYSLLGIFRYERIASSRKSMDHFTFHFKEKRITGKVLLSL